MRAQETRRGGRHLARERGSEAEPESQPIRQRYLVPSPLIERLSIQSLGVLAELLGVGVSDLLNRYSA